MVSEVKLGKNIIVFLENSQNCRVCFDRKFKSNAVLLLTLSV